MVKDSTIKSEKICLIIPSIEAGGAERVMTQLANYFLKKELEVHLILLVKKERFYSLEGGIKVYEPDFEYQSFSRPLFTFKILNYLRNKLKEIKPTIALSFGGRYNSFALLAAWGLYIPVFISDRSKPSISYGRFLDFLNGILYKKAAGIIAQTQQAKDILFNRLEHQNINVIGNPIRSIAGNTFPEKIILNVGRFVKTKQQRLLVKLFAQTSNSAWNLVFVGIGPQLEEVKAYAKELKISEKVIFAGRQKNVDQYFCKADIFAFTSVSEGFPNALGEAMNTPLACISFDIEAGPSDLIDDEMNGFLIKDENEQIYLEKLKTLMEDEGLRNSFRLQAKQKMKNFSNEHIGEKFYQFLFHHKKLDL